MLFALSASLTHAQTFLQPQVIPTVGWPYTIYSGDFDGDGHQDLLYLQKVTPQTGSSLSYAVEVVYGDGNGRFSTPVSFGNVNTAGSLITAVADMDRDGITDFIFVNGPVAPALQSTYTVWFGTAQRGVRAGPTSIWIPYGSVPPVYASMSTIDIGGAGPSLLVLDGPNKIGEVMRNTGGGRVQPTYLFSVPDGAGPMTVLDINGDGRPDLIELGPENHVVSIFPGTGNNPIFSAPLRFTGSTTISSMLIKDMTGDGKPDLIAEGIAGRIDVFPGNGDGTFGTSSIGGTGTLDGTTGNGGRLIAVADLNHDGQLDALTATPIGISSLLGQGTYLGLKGIYNAGPGMQSFATADFNGDGVLDVATDSPEGIAILYGNADGSFQTNQAYAAGQPAMSGALGVFNSSGMLDAVVSTAAHQTQVLKGKGDGSFSYAGYPGAPLPTAATTLAPGLWSVVQVADLDLDGNPDLLLTGDGGAQAIPHTPDGANVQLGDGTGNFAAPRPLTTVFGPNCTNAPGLFYGTSSMATNLIGAAPVNRSYDGVHYIYNGNHHFPSGEIYRSEVNGTALCGPYAHNLTVSGSFAPPNAFLKGVSDVFVQADGHLYFFPTYAVSEPLGRLGGDLSVDGSLTTVGQLTAPALSHEYNGTAVPLSAGGLGFRAFIGSAISRDLDGDGNQDLIVAYDNLEADHTLPSAANPNYVYIWFGDGTGRFPVSAKHPVNPIRFAPQRNYYQVVAADVNGDRVPDLVMSDGYLVSVQYGKGDGSFGPESHYLAGQGLNTISVGDLRRLRRSDLVVANGGTVFGNVVANREILTPNPDVNTGGITVLLNQIASAAVPASALSASPEPAAFEGAYSITATGLSDGSVDFSVDGNVVGSAVVVNGTATLNVPAYLPTAPVGNPLLPGSHALSGLYRAAQSALATTLTGTHAVSLAPSSVALMPTTPMQVYYGEPIDGIVEISVLDPNYQAVGTYSVLSNGVLVPGCINLANNGSCPYGNPQLLDAGTYVLTIAYNGGPANGDPVNDSSVSGPYKYVVSPDLTAATLATSHTPANFGTGVTFTATLTGNTAVPNGTVQFYDGGSLLGAGTLNAAGVAAFTTSSLVVGTHTITARYAGTIDFNPAATNAVTQQIVATPLASQVFLTSNSNPSPRGSNVRFTATVVVAGSSGQIATGTVSFLDGAAVIGSGVLNGVGVATFSTSALAVGSHAITASYIGDGATAVSVGTLPSVSAVLTELITTPVAVGFTLTVTPNPVTIGVGRTAVLLVTVTPVNGFSQAVSLSCAGTPYESACAFFEERIPAGGGSTTLNMSTEGPHDCGDPGHPYSLGSLGGGIGVTVAGLLLVPRRRRWVRVLMVGFAVGGLVGLAGCGHCTDLGTRPGTYSFVVSGVAQGGPVTQTAGVTVKMVMGAP